MLRRVIVVLLMAGLTVPAFGWGEKGHEISARAAVNALPRDFPAFFRDARERLVYLSPEPDRWKGGRNSPATGALNPADHYFDLEYWGDAYIPTTRYALLFEAYKRGLVDDKKPVSLLGTAPIAIAELLEKLTGNFKEWRDSREDNAAARTERKQIEENIIYNAGVMAHYITDLANPLHNSVHHNGWAEGYPNPKKYPSPREAMGIHSRFESTYVDNAIDEKDIPQYVGAQKRLPAGPWVPTFETYIRRNNALVEKLYDLDGAVKFGRGGETAEQHTFVLQRLAEGASMLRDAWATAWLNSYDEWLADPVMIYGRQGKSLLELLRERNHVETKHFDKLGDQVMAIGNRKNGLEGHEWMYYVGGPNGMHHGAESADKYVPRDNERVEWRFVGAGSDASKR